MKVNAFTWFWCGLLYVLNAMDFLTTFVGVTGSDLIWEKNPIVRWILAEYGWGMFFGSKFIVFGVMLGSVVLAVHGYSGKSKRVVELGVDFVLCLLCIMYVVIVVGNMRVLGWV